MESKYHKIRKKKTKPFLKTEWQTILSRNDISNVSKIRLKDSLISGVPADLRGRIWLLLTKSSQFSSQFSPSVYRKLLTVQVDEIHDQILRDVHRTFPEHQAFQDPQSLAQRALTNILLAYSNYDSEVGYCQGMGFIAGMLVLQLKNEELAFWTFVQIMHEYNWRLLYKDGTPRLIIIMRTMKIEIKQKLSDIYMHFKRENVELAACLSHYILTIFLYDTPVEIGLRIFDLFLFEGERVLFELLFKMFVLKKEKILALQSEELYSYLRKRIVTECFEENSFSTLFSCK